MRGACMHQCVLLERARLSSSEMNVAITEADQRDQRRNQQQGNRQSCTPVHVRTQGQDVPPP